MNGRKASEMNNSRMHWFSYGCFNEKVNEQVLTMRIKQISETKNSGNHLFFIWFQAENEFKSIGEVNGKKDS